MLKIKNIFILLILILLLCGCSEDTKESLEERTKVNDDICLEIYCDKEYNVEYIRDICWRKGGITVRLDENGNVIHCNTEKASDEE